MKGRRTATFVVLTSSSLYITWRLLRWRARKRTRKTVERVQNLVREGPLIPLDDPEFRQRILETAIKRASKWMKLRESAQEMIGQVGGVSVHKRPLLVLKPDYVLKPLQTDHRGLRELAFYEGLLAASRSSQQYAQFLRPKSDDPNIAWLDTLAVAICILLHDPVVMEQEAQLGEAWKKFKKEVDALRKLSKFIPPYYGVLGQKRPDRQFPFGINDEAHLLLQNVTNSFKQPCVMDLKMGSQSYEPDAPVDKRTKEYSKYPQQTQFAFRIVGMRYYDPSHKNADEHGFVLMGKEYGRSLVTHNQLVDAFRMFFTAGMSARPSTNDCKESVASLEDTPIIERQVRTKTISNICLVLRRIRRWFEENETNLRFCASSLLIVFEGDLSRTNGIDSGSASLKMIDFGRVRRDRSFDASSTDEGYVRGLRTLQDILTTLLEENKQTMPSNSVANGFTEEIEA